MVGKVEMGKMCMICETGSENCEMPAWHAMCGNDAKGLQQRQEILFGKHEEQSRVDALKGREAKDFPWTGEMMEESEARATWRAHGKAMAQKLAEAREESISKKKCGICMLPRKECDWPEVHFSRKSEWVAFCNEVGCMCCSANGSVHDVICAPGRLHVLQC